MMIIPTDIAIIGGGMAGLSLALACAKIGLTVAVAEKTPYDAQHLPAFDGRVSAIALGSKRMLERLGVWAGMAPYAEPILDIRVSDGQSPFFLHYDHQEVGDETDRQPFGWIVENRYTRKALFDVARAYSNISFYQASITNIAQGAQGCVVGLSDGTQLQAALVVGADGKFSKTRELAGIAVHQARYQQTALVCTIGHEIGHQGLAQERFLPRGPFAVLPMQRPSASPAHVGGEGGGCSSLVWVEPEALAGHYLALDKHELAQEISERVGGYLGTIEVVGDVFSYPLGLSLAESFNAGHVALIGDAAHAIHPIAGQGINLGFRDVAVLAELIERQYLAELDIGAESVMADYARWRRLDTLAMAGVTDGLNRLFSNHILPVRLARGGGLFAVSKLPSLKKLFMRHAMGISGDLPALMRV